MGSKKKIIVSIVGVLCVLALVMPLTIGIVLNYHRQQFTANLQQRVPDFSFQLISYKRHFFTSEMDIAVQPKGDVKNILSPYEDQFPLTLHVIVQHGVFLWGHGGGFSLGLARVHAPFAIEDVKGAIKGERSLLGRSHIDFSINRLDLKTDTFNCQLAGMTMNADLNLKNKIVDNAIKLESAKVFPLDASGDLVGKNPVISLQQLRANMSDMRTIGNVVYGKRQLNFSELTINDASYGEIKVQPLSFALTIDKHGEKSTAAMTYIMDGFSVDDQSYGSSLIDLTLSNIDSEKLNTWAGLMIKVGNNEAIMDQSVVAETTLDLLEQGVSADLNVDFDTGSGPFNLKLTADIPVDLAEKTTVSLQKHSKVGLTMNAPYSWTESTLAGLQSLLSDTSAQHSADAATQASNPDQTKMTAENQAQSDLKMLIGLNILRRSKGVLSLDAEYKDGSLMINGKPSLIPLGGIGNSTAQKLGGALFLR